MKKQYTYPTIEILPFCAMIALCGSGGGGDPEELGRVPRRPVF